MADLFEMFSDDNTRRVFETIADRKRADLRDLRVDLKLPEETAAEILSRLTDGGLVERIEGPLPDFNTYFLSAKGLAARRQTKALFSTR
jgi:DNA-binding MarR family transcriptional regulator